MNVQHCMMLFAATRPRMTREYQFSSSTKARRPGLCYPQTRIHTLDTYARLEFELSELMPMTAGNDEVGIAIGSRA